MYLHDLGPQTSVAILVNNHLSIWLCRLSQLHAKEILLLLLLLDLLRNECSHIQHAENLISLASCFYAVC